LYNTCAVKPSGLGLGSHCVQMQTDAGASSTVVSMEVQEAHTLASASTRLRLCGDASTCNNNNKLLYVSIVVLRAVTSPRVQ